MSDPKDYEIGYGKPPKENRFKKGQSGNPTGRPKGSKNVASIFEKTDRRTIKVNKGGRIVRMCLKEAIIHQLVNKAASGDLKAIREYLYCQRIFVISEQITGSPGEFSEKDGPVVTNILKRLARQRELLLASETETEENSQ